ncbi:glucanotransferase domain of glycogen debranching enzyme-domain-containing protein [Sphaerosporella brunnea]|uniref:Glycogen debranching enzyme n=1 Tax=Sphaerosporella brunnea TaxID=1250544 RepID=A0A5J5EPD6_9PEZI|nr:glucanotransferase domain of glycogen debranching enzyme-domain-containing protein [Sphaerosporella brunnea]
MAPSAQDPPLVYLLHLNDAGAPDVGGDIINLPAPIKPYTLRFAIQGASSICREGKLWINVPEEGQSFERENFRDIPLNPSFGRALHIDIKISKPGTYCYYISYTPLPPFTTALNAEPPKPTRTDSFYVTVAPSLAINGEPLQLSSLSVCSVLSKFLGPVNKWDAYMKYISQKGYNMVHFTPLMERGASNSPFSLFNQCNFDPIAFPGGERDVRAMVTQMETEHGILSLTDVVWNHTAHNSEWLQHHPEAGYNRLTAPWLESAYQFDEALLDFSRKLGALGYPTELKTVEDLLKVMDGIKIHVIAQLKLWEFYILDVKANVEAIITKWATSDVGAAVAVLKGQGYNKEMTLQEKAIFLAARGMRDADRLGERFRKYIDAEVGAAFVQLDFGSAPSSDDSDSLAAAEKGLKSVLDEINLPFYKEYDVDIAEAQEQLYNRIDYTRIADHGPKMGPITEESPLIETYFTRLPLNDITKKHDPKSLAVANNGWLWANTSDFASSKHKSYLRREVITWGDCVKLRYGDKPEDSPYLWDFMAKYTTLMAQVFHGFRIDNCHSTPIHVGEYMLDIARRVRPDLYTVAELFTGDERKDKVFLERLGLSSLIREAMVAWGPGELSRLLHRHGGKPIGSFEQEFVTRGAAQGEMIRKVTGAPIHALFMDCTHDNEVPTQKRTPQDTLPNGALSTMCDCAIGSVVGFDEIYPHLIDLVHETRTYEVPPDSLESPTAGIASVKAIMNEIHSKMGKEGYTEMHVHHEGDYITMHRVHPKSHHGYFLIAHCAFTKGTERGNFNPVAIPRTKVKSLGTWSLEVDGSPETIKEVMEDPTTLRGLPSKLLKLDTPRIETTDDATIITIGEVFPPGSIALFETWVEGFEGTELDSFSVSGAEDAFKNTDLKALNYLLYRCDAEERDTSDGKDGVYNVPGHGALVYAGLQGWWSVVEDIVKGNNLGHPLCDHLRSGIWALDWTVGRLEKLSKQGHGGLEGPIAWLRERFDKIKAVPSFLVPRYFALVLQTAYVAATERAISLFGENIQQGTDFLKSLALVSVQMNGYTKTGSLWPDKEVSSMAAGLPHFAVQWARCWGRDVFISLRGLHLAVGRYSDAREHILAFASVLKHGMIPNLLGAGKTPRYNARDSIWFFLQAIQDYTIMVPDGQKIIQEKVKRRFLPYDDTWFPVDDPRAYSKESTIEEVIQEAMQRHAQGFNYKEANAGPGLDNQMRDEGFYVQVQPDWETGFVSGGNQWNCGTWMDKMGESDKAGNRGHPGTPRDGAAIEITGLLYSTLKWLATLSKEKTYKWSSVKKSDGSEITFEVWAKLIKDNFERCYYIPKDPKDDPKYVIKENTVNRRGIYKDLFGSTSVYEDYQLRPNYAIAMTVAPDIFDPEHALGCLELADTVLHKPLGIATLDPADRNYRPNYINSLDNDDFATAKGRNYHQGPEWLWPLGFFLRAMLTFDSKRRKTKAERLEMLQQLAARMEGCINEITRTPWAGLTELTNENGSFCSDSSPTQAWSAGCLVDLFYDAEKVDV